jgi:XTP/dITP diphosphohydrolase
VCKLVIASNNIHKIQEIQEILGDRFPEILSATEAGIMEEIPETGDSFLENAIEKATYVHRLTDCSVLADDSGLEVEALHGAPGIHSARYCGQHGKDMENNLLLLRNMEGVKNRKANFVCYIVLLQPGKAALVARGDCPGELLTEPRGNGGFGYDPLFYLPKLGKTMAELSPKEKNKISHRRQALDNLRNIIEGKCE